MITQWTNEEKRDSCCNGEENAKKIGEVCDM